MLVFFAPPDGDAEVTDAGSEPASVRSLKIQRYVAALLFSDKLLVA
jgi:hypothetical protein